MTLIDPPIDKYRQTVNTHLVEDKARELPHRRKIIAGNWKMNGLRGDGLRLLRVLAQRIRTRAAISELLICPPATLLALSSDAIAGTGILLGGQDCHHSLAGAFNGSISAEMLKDVGCTHVILGHSERRRGLGESDWDVRAKVLAAWRAGLIPVVCVGETSEQRRSGRALDVVVDQLSRSVPDGSTESNLIIAYEPVWAIGSGLKPKNAEIAEMHTAISTRFPQTRIIYGGSVTTRNAADILAIPNVAGALVGGASLYVDEFWSIACASSLPRV
jgi:triosephosphate isomerase